MLQSKSFLPQIPNKGQFVYFCRHMSKSLGFAIIITLATLTAFANIGGLDVYALDEAKNAEAARAMYVSGDYVVPMYNGELRTDKPPLHYYFMSAGYALFGVNAVGTRFFSSLFAVITVVMTFLFAQKHFGGKEAIYSCLVLISSLHFNLQMHMSVPDPYLIFFLTWAFFSFYEAYKNNNKWALVQFYFAIGCGLLTKGPIALALPGISVVVFLVINKDFKWRTIWRLQPFLGVVFSLLVALPWYYQVHLATDGQWTDEFFFKHNFSRFNEAMEGHQGIFLLTFGYVFLLGFLGVLPFVFQSIKKTFKAPKNEAQLWLIIVISVIIIFFAFSSTKLPNYTTPSYPLIAILTGIYLSNLNHNWLDNLWNRIGLVTYAILLILFPVGIYFGLKADPLLESKAYVSSYFVILSIVGILIILSVIKRNIEIGVRSILTGWLAMILIFFYFAYPPIDTRNPVSRTRGIIDPEAKIIAYQRLNAAFVFEYERVIPKYNELSDILKEVRSNTSGYIISRTAQKEELMQISGLKVEAEVKDIFENPTTLILSWGKD